MMLETDSLLWQHKEEVKLLFSSMVSFSSDAHHVSINISSAYSAVIYTAALIALFL